MTDEVIAEYLAKQGQDQDENFKVAFAFAASLNAYGQKWDTRDFSKVCRVRLQSRNILKPHLTILKSFQFLPHTSHFPQRVNEFGRWKKDDIVDYSRNIF